VPEHPIADVRAFSIDDATTTEVDDAFSVRGSRMTATRSAFTSPPRRSAFRADRRSTHWRARLSTVYMPGRKLTMLPDGIVDIFTLAEGRSPPALSLYAK
jgi:exoribonuclease-2